MGKQNCTFALIPVNGDSYFGRTEELRSGVRPDLPTIFQPFLIVPFLQLFVEFGETWAIFFGKAEENTGHISMHGHENLVSLTGKIILLHLVI